MVTSRSRTAILKVLIVLSTCGAMSVGTAVRAAQSDGDEADDSGSDDAAQRFPQSVNVGTLIGRMVLEPLESRPKLGSISRIVKDDKNGILFVVEYGGFFGFGARPIAVPIASMALLGKDTQIIGLTPGQLEALPTFTGAGDTPLSNDEVIRVGLGKPAH